MAFWKKKQKTEKPSGKGGDSDGKPSRILVESARSMSSPSKVISGFRKFLEGGEGGKPVSFSVSLLAYGVLFVAGIVMVMQAIWNTVSVATTVSEAVSGGVSILIGILGGFYTLKIGKKNGAKR